MEQSWRVRFDHDPGFEIKAGRESKVLMERPRVAVNAAVLAAAVRIDAGFEAHVRAVVVSDNGAGGVLEKLRARQRILFGIPVGVGFEVDFLEPVGRIAGGAAAGERVAGHTLVA